LDYWDWEETAGKWWIVCNQGIGAYPTNPINPKNPGSDKSSLLLSLAGVYLHKYFSVLKNRLNNVLVLIAALVVVVVIILPALNGGGIRV